MAKRKKLDETELLNNLMKKDVWSSEDKTLFRKLKIWIEFRNRIIKERGHCELCGYEKRATLHHIHLNDSAESYSNLLPERFKVLCNGCHKFLHRVYSSYKRKKDPIKPDLRFESILNEMIQE